METTADLFKVTSAVLVNVVFVEKKFSFFTYPRNTVTAQMFLAVSIYFLNPQLAETSKNVSLKCHQVLSKFINKQLRLKQLD